VEDRTLVVGAGPAGLAAARRFAELGLPFEVTEANDDVGGVWYYGSPRSPAYESLHCNSSRRLTEFPDFPMPASYPIYPDHRQAWRYLVRFADQYRLRDHIRFQREVRQATRAKDADGWLVEFSDGTSESYSAIVAASGAQTEPAYPRFWQDQNGRPPSSLQRRLRPAAVFHSFYYRRPEVFRGRRVVVVGGGNSAFDIAADAASVAEGAFLSLRRGYHVIPKMVFGRPSDAFAEPSARLGVPLAIRRIFFRLLVDISVGRPEAYGLPRPDHRLLDSHAVLGARALARISEGDLEPIGEIERIEGANLILKDGTELADIDVVVLATGYSRDIAYIDREHLAWSGGGPNLYLHVFHPERDDLFLIGGHLELLAGGWPMYDLQARLIGLYLLGLAAGRPQARRFRQAKREPNPDLKRGLYRIETLRDRYGVDFVRYRRVLQRWIRRLSGA
jgi:thioredoxin reductase